MKQDAGAPAVPPRSHDDDLVDRELAGQVRNMSGAVGSHACTLIAQHTLRAAGPGLAHELGLGPPGEQHCVLLGRELGSRRDPGRAHGMQAAASPSGVPKYGDQPHERLFSKR